MSTISKVFVDSSILIEAIKGNKVKLYWNSVNDINNLLFINETVVSEYLSYVLAINGGLPPKTLKEINAIPDIITKSQNTISILSDLSFLETSSAIILEVPKLMN